MTGAREEFEKNYERFWEQPKGSYVRWLLYSERGQAWIVRWASPAPCSVFRKEFPAMTPCKNHVKIFATPSEAIHFAPAELRYKPAQPIEAPLIGVWSVAS